MHVLKLKIALQPGDKELLNKRFKIMTKIHNVIVKHAQKLIRKLKRDKEYQKLLKEYIECNKKETDEKKKEENKKRKKKLSKQLNEIREKYGLIENELQSYAKIQANKYKNHVSSQQVQKEVTRVYRGVEKVLFGNGETLNFKKVNNQHTICGKSPTNGIQLYTKNHDYLPKKIDREGKTDCILWCGHWFKLEINYNDQYVTESLNHDVSYCEISRLAFNDGWHYYVNVYLKGVAPKKLIIGQSTMGIDPGTSTFAGVSESKVFLRELAPNVTNYEKKINKVQKQIDRSKHQTNPENYNKDGTIKEGKHKWNLSKNCKRSIWRLRTLHRKKAAYVKQSHEILVDEIIQDSCIFIVEKMSYQSLAKRSKKETKKSDKTIVVKNKSGKEKKVFKNKKKKRFGHSIGARAPASLLVILQRKCEQYELKYFEIDTQTFKASQYDHAQDKFIKCTLNDRIKIIDGTEVQRDLYSAFLISCSNKTYDRADRELCLKKFFDFVEMMKNEISQMKKLGISKKECFGF